MIFDLALPDHFRNPELAVLAAALNDGTREVRQELGEVTPEELAFAPMQGRHSAGAVLLHHAEVEMHWIRRDLFAEPEATWRPLFPEFPADWWEGGHWPDLDGMTLDEIYRRSDEVRRYTIERLATVEDPEWLGDGGGGDTVRWILNHLIGHESYHFGQAVLLVEMARSAEIRAA